ncbi:MAG: penicillin-binding protein, partial [Actinobacteria bacterium]
MDPTIHEAHRMERRGRRLPSVVLIGVIVVIGATWVGFFAFLGSNAAFGTVQDLQEHYVCDAEGMDLDFPNIGMLSEVYTSDGVLLGKLTERNSQPVPLDEIPDVVIAALLSAEDDEFYEHEGIDFKAIIRAALTNYGSEDVQGGSTITQQVVKQNFIAADRTIERKICEAVIAAELERRYSKDEILEFYINSVFYGSNAYGVTAAAQEYFGKSLEDLTIAEAATLFVPVRNPTLYHPRNEPANTLAARNRTIDQMMDNGFIAASDGVEAKGQPLGVIPHQGFEELAPQVMIAVRHELLRNPGYGLGETYADRKRAVFGCPAADTSCEGGGGLEITVTVDYGLQESANRVLRAWFRAGADGPTGAIAMVDNATGAVRVMASGLDYGTDIDAGERPYDLASQGARQPGSAFKPITLAAALENGLLDGTPVTLGSYWDRSSPAQIDCGFPCSDGGNIWTVENANGDTPRSLETLEDATINSRNTVYARLVNRVGPQQVVDMAGRLGIEGGLRPYPSITLGAFGVSPLEMASAFSVFAAQGERHEAYLIERIEDASGNVLYERDHRPELVLTPSIAAGVTSTLEKAVHSGTGTQADIGRPQAGKTGTATDYRDVWFVGYIPQYTTAVWVGYADAQIPLEDFTVWNDLAGKEQYYQRAFGGSLAAPIWKQFMQEAVAGLPVAEFPAEPVGTAVYRQTPYVLIPDVTEAADTEQALELG